MSPRSLRTTSTVVVLLLAFAAVLGLLTACGGPAAENAGPKAGADTASAAAGAPAAGSETAAPDAAASRAPGQGAPPPPSPLPALNDYAEQCLRTEPPQDGTEIGFFTADCSAQLLETLRACVGALRLPEAAVGESLSRAELAVRHLSAGVQAQADDVSDRAAAAAVALADLARAAATAAASGGVAGDASSQAALESAAGALDAETPLGEQQASVAAFFARADDVVRPLARAGGL